MAIIIDNDASNPSLPGTNSADVLAGLGGNDIITALSGNDVILGGSGSDTLWGGPGKDVLEGGLGNDTFYYNNTSESTGATSASDSPNRDVIIDFELVGDNDSIDVSDFDANTGVAGPQDFLPGRYTEGPGMGDVGGFGGNWLSQSIHANLDNDVVYFNTDVDDTPELSIYIPGLTSGKINFDDFIIA